MKKINRYILLSLIVGLTSCGKWLDVTPKDEIVEKDLYSQATGAQNILNGLYKALAKPELYGTHLTFGFTDVLGQVYNICERDNFYGEGISRNSPLYRIASFEYNHNDDIRKIISNIWEKQYQVIINANNLIYNVSLMDESLFKFGKEEKDLIIGEAYAIRAFCHLDLLRLYAPAPATNPQGKYIHYSTESDVNKPGFHTNPLTVDETLTLIEKDPLLAKDLITPFDTLTVENKQKLGSTMRFQLPLIPDTFYEFRGYRVNTIAVSALLARTYNYWGKHDQAVECANTVINFEHSEGLKAVTFAGGWSIRTDKKFKSDLIFAVSYPKLVTDYEPYANPDGVDPLTIKYYEELFVNYEFKDEEDYRYRYLLKVSESAWYGECYPLKNTPENSNEEYHDITPMIRLSEMYFAIADAYAAKNDFTNAQKTINKVRTGRNCKEANLGIIDMETYKQRFLEEVKREFFQEGQIFFQYKKHNVLMTKKMSLESFNIPIPESQNI